MLVLPKLIVDFNAARCQSSTAINIIQLLTFGSNISSLAGIIYFILPTGSFPVNESLAKCHRIKNSSWLCGK